MTNYRIETSYLEESMFNFCFTCGAKLKEVLYHNDYKGELIKKKYLTCSENPTHLKVFIEHEETDTVFI